MGEVAEAKRQIFLSYHVGDRERVRRLGVELAAKGLYPIDPATTIGPGEEFADAVVRAIRAADAVVFIVPEREGIGNMAWSELGAARAMGKRIVPIVVEPARFAISPPATTMARIQAIDATGLDDQALASAVAAALGEPSRPRAAAG